MSCECSEMDWHDVDMTREHHPACPRKITTRIAGVGPYREDVWTARINDAWRHVVIPEKAAALVDDFGLHYFPSFDDIRDRYVGWIGGISKRSGLRGAVGVEFSGQTLDFLSVDGIRAHLQALVDQCLKEYEAELAVTT